MYTHTYLYMFTHTHTHTRTHVYIYIKTDTHTHSLSLSLSFSFSSVYSRLPAQFALRRVIIVLAADHSVQHLARHWTRGSHALFLRETNVLFATLLLGVQRLEETGVLPQAHQAMLEAMLEDWTGRDDPDPIHSRIHLFL